MRRLILALVLAASLGACGKSDEGDGTSAGTAMTAEAIATNDVTAIDAVTGEAANMAADVVLDANLAAEGNATGNTAATNGERPSRRSSTPSRPNNAPAPADAPAAEPEPQANSAE